MKVQLCRFNRHHDSLCENGIAIMVAFGLYDIKCIVDAKGEKVENPYDYKLIDAPLAYIDSEYYV